MDSPPPQPSLAPKLKSKSSQLFQRFIFVAFFSLFTILSLSYTFGFFALVFATLSIPPPLSVPSQCRIVSSSVDLRTSRICELGLLNYKAKRVFYPSERRKFRCHYDYYWASIFKVEYTDHFSGRTLIGLAEAPKEALPNDCRPNFSTAWLTKHKLKVNETYDCRYTSGRSKVEIFEDSYFGCQANDPSWFEMIRRYSILVMEAIQSRLSGHIKARRVGWEMIAGAIGGFFTAIISVILFTLSRHLLLCFTRAAKTALPSLIRRVVLSRMFFCMAYFTILGWIAIQYVKWLGLSDLFVES